MLNVVIIDDERPAIRALEFLLKDYSDINIVGKYTNAEIAITEMESLKPHVVFLDISMPKLSGMEVTLKLSQINEAIEIVFITAFEQYALEAFELEALDYILKPITPERLEITIQRIRKKNKVNEPIPERKFRIKCLGGLQVAWENQEPIKWRAKKTKELFAFLLHNEGKTIPKQEILDQLWYEEMGEKALLQLYNGIYYIRKTLEEYGVDKSVLSISSNYTLKLGRVEYDIAQVKALEKTKEIGELEKMEQLFLGEYLEGENYSWAEAERESFINLHQNCLLRMAKFYKDNGEFDKVEPILTKAYKLAPYDENMIEILMMFLIEKGDKSKAIKHFKAYSTLIKKELDIEPTQKLYKIYFSIK